MLILYYITFFLIKLKYVNTLNWKASKIFKDSKFKAFQNWKEFQYQFYNTKFLKH